MQDLTILRATRIRHPWSPSAASELSRSSSSTKREKLLQRCARAETSRDALIVSSPTSAFVAQKSPATSRRKMLHFISCQPRCFWSDDHVHQHKIKARIQPGVDALHTPLCKCG